MNTTTSPRTGTLSKIAGFIDQLFSFEPKAEEAYLAGAVDLHDLECRMRRIEAQRPFNAGLALAMMKHGRP